MENGLLHNQTQRLWYQGPMFRHERPQKGRYRQFHQIGVETFGMAGPDIDAELILITARIWQALGIPGLELQINSLGTAAERVAYREVLVDYFNANADTLDEDSQRRLATNPLRILDSKNPSMRSMLDQAPSLMSHLGDESRAHFDFVRQTLARADIPYVVNPRLVRGLDYYSRTVFEWVTDRLGAQGTVCAGGRYDSLVEQLGGRAVPAVGFAMGLERLVAVLEEVNPTAGDSAADVYLVLAGEAAQAEGLILAETLRDALPQMEIVCNCGGGSMKAQFKRADRSGAAVALVLGDDELKADQVVMKPLRSGADQQLVARAEIVGALKGLLNFESAAECITEN
jgi:histidyl-tRNA synthetase